MRPLAVNDVNVGLRVLYAGEPDPGVALDERKRVRGIAIIRGEHERDCARVMSNTGNTVNNAVYPSSSGTLLGENHRSHCATSPGSQVNWAAVSTGRYPGHNRRTLSRNHMIDPVHSTRSATRWSAYTASRSTSEQRLERRERRRY